MKLRPYQRDLVQRYRQARERGVQRILLQLPTGGGKTVVTADIVRQAVGRGESVLVCVHRQELLKQQQRTLRRAGGLQVRVATIGTAQRLMAGEPPPDLIVVDEAHHMVATTWRRLLDVWPQAALCGCTATPERLDGSGLDDVFDELLCGPSTEELIQAGALMAPTVWSHQGEAADITSARGIERIVTAWTRHADGGATIGFASGRSDGRRLADAFSSAGIPSAWCDGATPAAERRQILQALAEGELKVAWNCDLWGEGVDLPSLQCVLICRRTESLAMWLQMVGRVLRPAPGKECATVIDCGDHVSRLGHPCAPRCWSLAGARRRRQAEAEAEAKAEAERARSSAVAGGTADLQLHIALAPSAGAWGQFVAETARRQRLSGSQALDLLLTGQQINVADAVRLQQEWRASPSWVVHICDQAHQAGQLSCRPADLRRLARYLHQPLQRVVQRNWLDGASQASSAPPPSTAAPSG